MKLTRRDALAAHQGLVALERGIKDKPFDFDWGTWDKIFVMLAALTPVNESYTKTRQKRLVTAANGKGVLDDPNDIYKFQTEDDEILSQTISVKLPKVLLNEDELRMAENKIPPSVRMQLKPLVSSRVRIEMDEDEDNY